MGKEKENKGILDDVVNYHGVPGHFIRNWFNNRSEEYHNNLKEMYPEATVDQSNALMKRSAKKAMTIPCFQFYLPNQSDKFSDDTDVSEIYGIRQFGDQVINETTDQPIDYEYLYNHHKSMKDNKDEFDSKQNIFYVNDPNLSRPYIKEYIRPAKFGGIKRSSDGDQVYMLTKAGNFKPQIEKIKSILNVDDTTASNVYNELMQLRFENKINPNQKISIQDSEWYRLASPTFKNLTSDQFNQILNDVAYNHQQSENQDITYAKKGKKLISKRNIKKCGFGDSLQPIAKAASGLLPIVGTYQDFKNFKENPTWSNAGWLATSALGDVLTLTGVGAGAGAALKASKAARLANATADAANTIRKTGNMLDSMADVGKTLNSTIDLTQKARVGNDLINSYTNV